RRRSLVTRLAISLSGAAALLCLAAPLLGPSSALDHFVSGFWQLPLGAVHPRTVAQDLIARLQPAFVASAPFTCGILSAKLAAFALLPLGGMSTAECFRQMLGRFGDHHAVTAFVTISALVGLVMIFAWTVA